jgi:hypothetical protein
VGFDCNRCPWEGFSIYIHYSLLCTFRNQDERTGLNILHHIVAHVFSRFELGSKYAQHLSSIVEGAGDSNIYGAVRTVCEGRRQLQWQVLNSFFGLPLAYWDCFCTPLVFLAMQLLMRVDFARYRGSLDYLKTAPHDSLVVSNAIHRLEELEEDLELIQSLEEAEKLLPPRPGYSSALETSDFMKKDPRHS